jgi:hypothetical protein
MAAIAKSGTPSLSSVVPPQNCVIGSGLLAGEAIAAGDLVYIKSDGKFWKSNGTSANAAAKVDGIAVKAAGLNQPVDAYRNVEMRYGAGMTPGARVFLSATAGLIGDAATTGGTAPVGFVVDATRIYVHGSAY